jgi:chemotaxis protein methyltransferase CheR
MNMLGGELTDDEFEKFRALIYRVAGIRIAETKRVMITNRLRRRLRATGLPSFSAYLAFVTSAAGSREVPAFLDEITTNETYFYRDAHHYHWFADEFLPEVAQEARAHQRPRSLRIWSAACSTGAEPYSLAIKLAENHQRLAGWRITLLGTDLSGAALAAARAGVYDARAVLLVGPEERARYFTEDPRAQTWTIKPEVRAQVSWKTHNLLAPLAVEPFDCIFLKNVLIYFDAESKKRVVDHVLRALAPGGYLVAGPTEGIYKMLDPLTRVKTWLYRRPPR